MIPKRLLFSGLILLVAIVGIPFGSGQSNVFDKETFTVQGYDGSSCYYYSYYTYNSTGWYIKGSVKVNSGKIDFFILNQVDYKAFGNGARRNCQSFRPSSSELTVIGTTSYSVDYKVPDNGYHYFVYFNPFTADASVTVMLTWSRSP